MKIIKKMFSWNRGSIIYKNFIIIALVVALPFCLLCSGLFALVYINTTNSEYASNYTTAYNTISIMDNFYSETKKSTIALAENKRVNEFVATKNPDNIYLDIEELISTNTLAKNYIDSIYIYSSLNRYVVSNNFTGRIDTFYDKGWLNGISEVERVDTVTIQVRDKYDQYPHLITFLVPIREVVDMNNQVVYASGGVVVNINIDKLCEELLGIPKEQVGIYVFNYTGKPIFYHDNEQISRDITYAQLKNEDVVTKQSNKNFVLEMESNGYYYVYMKPRMTSRTFITGIFFLLLLLFVFITFLVSYILAKKTFKPIENIVENLAVSNEYDNNSIDEVQYIINNINKQIENRQLLEMECENRMQMLNKIYMSALQMQINPHFIYNSLEIINFMAFDVYNGENDISKVATILSRLLRFSLNTEQKLVTVETEMNYLREYVQILKIRFPNKCNYTFLMDESVKEKMIPKLILQPIVENAFSHGVQLAEGTGEIIVEVKEEQGKIIITISNTGIPLTDEKLKSINDKLNYSISLTSRHIGLQNAQSRIKMLVGEEYGINKVCADGNKTVFVIELPEINQELI